MRLSSLSTPKDSNAIIIALPKTNRNAASLILLINVPTLSFTRKAYKLCVFLPKLMKISTPSTICPIFIEQIHIQYI